MTPHQSNVAAWLPTSNEFAAKVQGCIQKSSQTGRPFFIFVLHINNLESFEKKRSKVEKMGLLKDIGTAVRNVVHPSQFVGYYKNGLGLVFDAVDAGMVDKIAQRLVIVVQNALRSSHYNDFQGRWSDIIYQFIHPNDPGIVFPRVGWAVYPRDGNDLQKLIDRAHFMITQG